METKLDALVTHSGGLLTVHWENSLGTDPSPGIFMDSLDLNQKGEMYEQC